MKKYLYIIFGLLLIMAPTIFLAMENTNTDNSKKLSLQVQELCDLFSVQPEETFGFLSSTSSQEFLSKFNSSINISNDCSTLRQGIFKTIQILALIPHEEKNSRKELKFLCKTMYKRLASFIDTDTESIAEEYCYGVLDCLSDDEDNSKNQIHKNFAKFKLIKNSQNKNEQNKNELILYSQQQACIITGKTLEIAKLEEQLEQAQKEYSALTKEAIGNQEEIKAIEIAFNILRTGASNQLVKMQKQEQELQKQAKEQHTLVTQLQKEKNQLESINPADRTNDDANKFANKIIELSTAHKKLMEIKIEISTVTKYLAEAKGQTGFLKNLAWNLNIYNYPSSTPLKKD